MIRKAKERKADTGKFDQSIQKRKNFQTVYVDTGFVKFTAKDRFGRENSEISGELSKIHC